MRRQSAPKARKLAVIVPCYNEEEVVGRLYEALRRERLEDLGWQTVVTFVDDGSTDATLARLNALAAAQTNVRVCALSRNFGQQVALTAGLELAQADADAYLVMDADLQNPPNAIPAMLAQFEAGHDVVMGVRSARGGRGWFKRWTSDAFYWLFNRLSEVPIKPSAPDFFLLSSRARRTLLAMPERTRFLRGMVAWIGFDRAYVAYEPPARLAGQSKYSLGRMLSFAADALFAFSAAPMRLAVRAGALVALLGILYLTYIVARQLVFHTNVEGWSSIMSVVLILGGLQLIMIGLVGGYVARIFEESKGRPLYVLRQRPDDTSTDRATCHGDRPSLPN